MKIGFIIDSSSGISNVEADKKHWGFLPLVLSIDDKEYIDGINMDIKKFNQIITINSSVKTSATPPGKILEVYTEMSKKFDKVIVYPLSNKLSSQNNNLKIFAENFPKIMVATSMDISYGIVRKVEIAEKMAKEGKTIDEIFDYLNFNEGDKKTIGGFVVENMDWLVKGGRVSGTTAAMAKLTKIVPIIKFDGSMSKWGKGRTLNKTFKKTIQLLKDELGENIDKYEFHLICPFDLSKEKMKRLIDDELDQNTKITNMANAIVLHTGPKVFAIYAIKIS